MTTEQSMHDLLNEISWPSGADASAFANALENLWQTDRLKALQYIKVVGKPSQFLGHKVWSFVDAKTHWEFHAVWESEEGARVAAMHGSENGEPKKRGRPPASSVRKEQVESSPEIEAARVKWRDSIQQRNEALSLKAEEMRQAMEKLRSSQAEFVLSWNEYVRSTHEAYKNARGY